MLLLGFDSRGGGGVSGSLHRLKMSTTAPVGPETPRAPVLACPGPLLCPLATNELTPMLSRLLLPK